MKMHSFSILLIFQFYGRFSMEIPVAHTYSFEMEMDGEEKL